MKKILALLMTFILIIGLAGCGSAGAGGNEETELDVFMTVSYTHLDVYKRQT